MNDSLSHLARKQLPGGCGLAATIFSSAFFWYNCGMKRKMNRKSWKWEKIRGRKKNLRPSSLVCGFVIWLLHSFESHTRPSNGAWGMLCRIKSISKDYACTHQTQRFSNFSFCWNSQRFVFWGDAREGCSKEEPIQSLHHNIITLRASLLSLILHLSYELAETFLVHFWTRIHKSNTFKLVF